MTFPSPALCFLLLFNIGFVIFGLTCMGIGIWVRSDNSALLMLYRMSPKAVDLDAYNVPSMLEQGANILIAVGGLVFLVAIFGFCGAIKKDRVLLLTYGCLVGIILIIQLSGGVTAAVYKNEFDRYAKTFLNTTVPFLYVGPYNKSDPVSLAVDHLQVTKSCCGVNGPDDYSFYPRWNRTWLTGNASIPYTCCKYKKSAKRSELITLLEDINCPVTRVKSHTEGCYAKLKALLYVYAKVMLGVAIGITLVEFVLITIACVLARKKKKDEISETDLAAPRS